MAKVSYKDLKPELTSDELQEIENAAARTMIRLSEKAQKFSKSYGKGYTSFFSRLIDAALDDAALVKKCL